MKPAAKAPAGKVADYERLIATLPEVDRKGAALPYTSVNGNMFTLLGGEGVMGMRLAAGDREAFMREHGAKLYEAYGAVMKEYVAVPGAMLADTAALAPWLVKSWSYAQGLKPKPTKRPKAE
jgi:hypothetical protein